MAEPAPIPLIIHCPCLVTDQDTGKQRMCGARHIDEGELATRPHKTHACQTCGQNFCLSVVPTVGVQFLPGCKNEACDRTNSAS